MYIVQNSYQHTKSCRLLLHYLEQKYKVTKTAADKYRKILKTIDEFDFLTKKGRVAFQEIDISLFSDLLLELYDLQTV